MVTTLDRLTAMQIGIKLLCGKSNKHIRKALRVTDQQIRKVVEFTGFKRSLYRDGESSFSRWVEHKAMNEATKTVKPKLLTYQG